MKKFFVAGVALAGLLVVFLSACGGKKKSPSATVVKAGKAIPILVAAEAPQVTRTAANDLADYIAEISGVRPEVISELPEAGLSGAIWVGAHPQLGAAMPGIDFSFQYPEEIRIVSQDGHIAIVGRDVRVGDVQREAGTANAVYTFAQKYLQIRWLWPGAWGEDFPQQAEILMPETDYVFHPPFVQRDIFRNLARKGAERALPQWCKTQRLLYDSFDFPASHAFADWWDQYHESHPEYFALQPDGTRGTFPDKPNVKKLCEGEPAVWQQWLANVGDELKASPAANIFNASQNDSTNNGICVDPRCMAWDHPKGELYRYNWRTESREYPAMTNRYVTFWNKLAALLKEKYPDEFCYVAGFAYGPAKPAPIDLKPASNVAIAYVGGMPILDDARRAEERASIEAWGRVTNNLFFRPNFMWYTGGFNGVPAVTFRKTMEDFRFLADNGCRGIIIDTLPEHWATQGPMYYLMGQLAWDPRQDGEAVMADFYQRGFGAAAGAVQKYFELMERAHNSIMDRADWAQSGRMYRPLAEYMLLEAFTPDILREARTLLNQAKTEAAGTPLHEKRVSFITKGLNFTEQALATMTAMNRVRPSKGSDAAAVAEAEKLVRERDAFFAAEDAEARRLRTIAPISSHRFNMTYVEARKLQDYLGPVSEEFKKAAAEGGESSVTPATTAPARAVTGDQFRWTGRAGNGEWSTAENWEVFAAAQWSPAAKPPAEGSIVTLGDASPEGEQSINLTNHTKINRLVVAASAGRTYVIQTRDDSDTLGLDSDSGALFKLELTDATPLIQKPEAGGVVRIKSDLILSAEESVLIRLNSRQGGRIEIEGNLTPPEPRLNEETGSSGVWTVVPREPLSLPPES